MKGLHPLLAALLVALLLAAAPVSAQQSMPWYEIELIIFRQPEPTGADAELYPVDPPAPQAEQVVSLRQPQASTKLPYSMLGSNELQLSGIYQSLKSSSHYEPLLHIGWRQPGVAGSEAASVAIPSDWRPWTNGSQPPLHGLVRFQQDRFLHLTVDLRLQPPPVEMPLTVLGLDAEPPVLPTYVHQQSRRLRTGELHYLDHPTLGVIAQVRPLASD